MLEDHRSRWSFKYVLGDGLHQFPAYQMDEIRPPFLTFLLLVPIGPDKPDVICLDRSAYLKNSLLGLPKSSPSSPAKITRGHFKKEKPGTFIAQRVEAIRCFLLTIIVTDSVSRKVVWTNSLRMVCILAYSRSGL